MTSYKCYRCLSIVDTKPCPVCGNEFLKEMCPNDHNHCSHDITNGIKFCPICKESMCPICGSHDVMQVSRVTGYLSDVAGWNNAKRAELMDRTRYDILKDTI